MKREIVCRFNELTDMSNEKKYTFADLNDPTVKKFLEGKINENINRAFENVIDKDQTT